MKKTLGLLFCFFIISLVFSQTTTFSPSNVTVQKTDVENKKFDVYYLNNTLIIQGESIHGNLKIYSIIGNMIVNMEIHDFSEISIPLDLEKQNMYIIRVETADHQIFTHKIVAR